MQKIRGFEGKLITTPVETMKKVDLSKKDPKLCLLSISESVYKL
jgi:hypothetical protein